MKKHNLAFVDVETTGTNPHLHEIIEIAGLIVKQIPQPNQGPKLEVLDEFEFKIKPKDITKAEPQALRINGYNEADWLFAAELEEVMKVVANKVKDCIMVGQNVSFDWMFVEEAFIKAGIKNPMHYHKIDLLPMFFAKTYHDNKVDRYNLSSIAEYYGLTNQKAHTALADIKTTFEAYKKVLDIN